MRTYKVIAPNGITYRPKGPGSEVRLAAGELLVLDDRLDYLVGTQIGPNQVKRFNPAELERAPEPELPKVEVPAELPQAPAEPESPPEPEEAIEQQEPAEATPQVEPEAAPPRRGRQAK